MFMPDFITDVGLVSVVGGIFYGLYRAGREVIRIIRQYYL
jgi:hypothetical protein